MPPGESPDPVRATLVAILQQLNRVESMHEGRARDQVLTLADLERMLAKFWAVEQGLVKLPLVLGLLVRNGMVEAVPTAGASPTSPAAARTTPKAHYRIAAGGKQFLVESQQKSDRIS